jgi:hypothetical protein
VARRKFILVREGETAFDADDLAVIDDPAVAAEVARIIARRLGVSESNLRALRPVPAGGASEKDGES